MSEDDLETFNEIRTIRSRVEAIEHTQEILVRAHGEEVLSAILSKVSRDDVFARVYLEVDGRRTQQEIAAALRAKGLRGASEPTVSRKLESLQKDYAMVELAERTRKGKIYRKTALDRILGVSRRIVRELGIL